MGWQFLNRDKNHRDTFRLSKMALETGEYTHDLDAYQIVPLAKDTQLTDKLSQKQARKRHDIIANELPERATRFSTYLGSIDTDTTLNGLQNWIRRTAELSTEPSDQGLRPQQLRPRLRAMHFDAACLLHQLVTEALVLNTDRWRHGFAGDAPLFKQYQNIPVFPVLWSLVDTAVHLNMYDYVRQEAANHLLGGKQMPLSQWVAELDTVSPAIHPVEELRQYWSVGFIEQNGYPPGLNDLLDKALDLKLHSDDVPKDILEDASKRPGYGGNS